MKVLQVTKPGEYTILDLPVPRPGPDEVLVRVLAVTTCPQWDLHLRHNEPMFVGHSFHYPYTPGQPGHEATGEIAAVGAGVTGFAVGDRVSAWRDPGHDRQGCYAQYVLMKADHVIKVPGGFPAHELAPVELAMCVGTVFRMLASMGAVKGTRFGVSGLGPAGLIAAQMARAEGAAEVIGFDITPGRRALALEQGLVDAALDPREDGGDVAGLRHTARALDSAIDCVGSKASVHFLMDRTRDSVALFGVQREPFTFDVRHYLGLRLCGYKGHSKESAEYAVRLIERGELRLGLLSSRFLPLESYGEGVDLLERQEALKICFLPWDEEGAGNAPSDVSGMNGGSAESKGSGGGEAR